MLKQMSDSRVILCFALCSIVSLSGCYPAQKSNCLTLQIAEQPSHTIKINQIEIEDAKKQLFKSSEAHAVWEEMTAMSNVGWHGWRHVFKLFADDSELLSKRQNPIVVPSGQSLHGLLLIRNGWQKTHNVRVVILINFQSTKIETGGKSQDFIEVADVQPEHEVGLNLAFEPLNPGFYQVSIIFVSDFDSLSTDPIFRSNQKSSIKEERYDLWVGMTPFAKSIPVISNPLEGETAGTMFTAVEVDEKANWDNDKPLAKLTANAGSDLCLYLHFFNLKPTQDRHYRSPIPLRIAVFWNDRLTQTLVYSIKPEVEDKLTIPLAIQTPKQLGINQLQITPFVLPGYSQFDSLENRTLLPISAFTRRVLVETIH